MLSSGNFGTAWKPSLSELEKASSIIASKAGGAAKPKRKRPKFIRKVVCQVCGDVANDHIHYGAIACYSCRAFFRRGVNANAPYFCSQAQNCVITKSTRKHCQYCRFQKCLSIGMKGTWVMTDEDKREKKEKALFRKIEKLKKDDDKKNIVSEIQSIPVISSVTQRLEHSRSPGGPSESSSSYLASPSPGSSNYYTNYSSSSSVPGASPAPSSVSESQMDEDRSSMGNVEQMDEEMSAPGSSRMAEYSPNPGSSRMAEYSPSPGSSRMAEYSPSPGSSQMAEYSPNPGSSQMAEYSPNPGSSQKMAEYSPIPYSPARSPINGFRPPEVSFFVDPSILGKDMTNQPTMPFTLEEHELVQSVIRAEMETTKMITVSPEVLMTMVQAAKSGSAIPYKILLDGYMTCMKRIIKFASHLDFFQSFCPSDQRELLLSNVDMVVNIRSARLLRPGQNLQTQLTHVVGGDGATSGDVANSKVVQQFGASPPTQPKIQYRQIYQSPWACDSVHEQKFGDLMESIFHLEMDRTTTILMSLVVLFSSDNLELKDKAKCVRNQEFFIQLLFRYLVSMVGKQNANALLPKYMQLCSKLAEMAQIMITKRLTL